MLLSQAKDSWQMSRMQQDTDPSSCQVILSLPWPEIYLSLLIFLHNVLLPFFLSTSFSASFYFFVNSLFPEHFDVLTEYSYMK